MASINFYLYPYVNKKNEQLVILVYQHKGAKLNHSTNIKIQAKAWDTGKQRVKPQYPNAADYNAYLASLREQVTRAMLELKIQGLEPVVPRMRERLFPKENKDLTLLQGLFKFIEAHRTTHSHEFVQKYQTMQADLERYEQVNRVTLHYSQMDSGFFERYTQFLITEKKNTNNTVAKKLSFLKTFLGWSVRHKLHHNRDFEEAKTLSPKRSIHIALTESELQHLARLNLKKDERLERVRDVFCFGCYTGLRYSDIENLKPENIVDLPGENGHKSKGLRINIIKTHEHLTIPLAAPALSLLEKYGYQLPVMSNQKTNVYLKELGKVARLDSPVQRVTFRGSERIETRQSKYELVTTHTARRTFATLSAARGMNLVVLQRILGHANIKQTMEYIKEVEGAKISEVQKVWG
ncbi:MAG: site-specific integrase [Bacteroidetes bacterium]|nr:site-specific integrase [Bacteroidota bacterium]